MPLIREERPEDAEAVHALLVAAFGREAEARLVERLRASGKLICALVAEENGRVLGHMALSQIAVKNGGGEIPALALAPLAVIPAFQRLGIGSALVSAGLARCRELGHARVVVLGGPDFYARFGFAPAAEFGIRHPGAVPSESFMALALVPGGLDGCAGEMLYSTEFAQL